MVVPADTFRARFLKGLVPFFVLFMVLFFIPVQTFLFEGIKIGGVKPDLGFILAYVIGLVTGFKNGLVGGLLFGGLQDFFSMGDIGLQCLLKGGVGLSIGLLERAFLYFSIKAHTGVIFCISLLQDLIGAIGSRGLLPGLQSLSWMMVGQALYNGMIATGILLVLSWRNPPGEGFWTEKKLP